VIVGVGIDVCSVGRMAESLARFGDRMWARILTEGERDDLAPRADRATALAGRFAVKEALFKAMAGAPGVGFHDLEIRGAPRRAPTATLRGPARALADRMGVARVHVSITHDAGVAAAVAILEGEPGSRVPDGAPSGPEPRAAQRGPEEVPR
jgi:holo-[acyl-carrier protein] synthase